MNSIVISSCIRGYHIYQDRWTPVNDEELRCQRERGNIQDLHAVAVLKDDIVVGHVLRKISTLSSMFLRFKERGADKVHSYWIKTILFQFSTGGNPLPAHIFWRIQ